MRTIISMKMINCNGWALNNKLKTSMLIEPSVGDLQVYFACSPGSGRLAWFYYRLGEFGLYGFYGGGYLNEGD
jgi:hypothetical protein